MSTQHMLSGSALSGGKESRASLVSQNRDESVQSKGALEFFTIEDEDEDEDASLEFFLRC